MNQSIYHYLSIIFLLIIIIIILYYFIYLNSTKEEFGWGWRRRWNPRWRRRWFNPNCNCGLNGCRCGYGWRGGWNWL